jgi:hypothetical protein
VTEIELKERISEQVQKARRLRDEIRLELHLASMEARDRWKMIEPALSEAERFAGEASEVAKAAAEDVVRKFGEFQASLGRRRRELR